MMIPACAPSTPASKEPALDVTLPFSYSAVSSPRYQTLPAPSWAYQSYVISTGCPFRLTTSWMTLASTPVGDGRGVVGDGHLDVVLRPLTVGLLVDPLISWGHRPVGVSMCVVKSAGSSFTG